MAETFNCDSCGQEMELKKKFDTKPRGERKNKYRVRRFACALCGIHKTIFAGGWRDDKQYNNQKLK